MTGVTILALLADTAGAAAQSCQPKVAAGALIKPGTLIMSTNPTLPPMQYVNQQGELVGMRVELGTEIAKRLCLTPEYVRIEFSAMIPGLNAGRWDMINTGIFFTEERAKLMQMIPYEYQAISISAPKGNPGKITKVEDLAGKAVGVEIGGFEERRLRDIDTQLKAKNLAGVTIRTFDNFATAYQALRAGQTEATVSIDSVAKEYQDRGDFDRVLNGLFPTPVALALKNKDLADAVVRVLNEMRADGSYKALFDRFGLTLYEGTSFAIKGPSS
jgi:polar amino acid transport system substrate-binding protein